MFFTSRKYRAHNKFCSKLFLARPPRRREKQSAQCAQRIAESVGVISPPRITTAVGTAAAEGRAAACAPFISHFILADVQMQSSVHFYFIPLSPSAVLGRVPESAHRKLCKPPAEFISSAAQTPAFAFANRFGGAQSIRVSPIAADLRLQKSAWLIVFQQCYINALVFHTYTVAAESIRGMILLTSGGAAWFSSYSFPCRERHLQPVKWLTILFSRGKIGLVNYQ